jgi:riboflavin kinase / FMN adenylyltransferase
MQFIRGLHNLRERHRGCAVTIGNFDGMHLGHQALLNQLKAVALELNAVPTVVIFEPQPREYFQPQSVPARLTRLREKLGLLHASGIERVLCLHFDARLAALEAEAFAALLLVRGLAAKAVIIGDDFRFGRQRRGDLQMLQAIGAQQGFTVQRASSFVIDGERVSSSRVREALQRGDMPAARRLLGHHYWMSGRVAHGDKRGRQIGYPTINIDLHRARTPIDGIFAARVHGLAAKAFDAMAYIGTRPVVQGEHKRLEVHVFDYAQECYGSYVRVEFVRKLREDRNFDSLDALKVQMRQDAVEAKAALIA